MISAIKETMLRNLIILLGLSFGVLASPRNDYSGKYIRPSVIAGWGACGTADWCPYGTIAQGISLKVERFQGGGRWEDVTAPNRIRLHCRSLPCQGATAGKSGTVMSTEGPFGGWKAEKKCSLGYVLTAAQSYSEKGGDDTGATNYNFKCRGLIFKSATHQIDGDGHNWGTRSPWTECPTGTAICGIKTKMEGFQKGGGDDTGLDQAEFYCCNLTPSVCTPK